MKDIGFVTDDDRREIDTNPARRFRLKRSFLEEGRTTVNYNEYGSQSGVLHSWDLKPSVELTFRKKWMLGVLGQEECKLYERIK